MSAQGMLDYSLLGLETLGIIFVTSKFAVVSFLCELEDASPT